MVFMKLVGLWVITEFGTGLDAVQESGGGADVNLITRARLEKCGLGSVAALGLLMLGTVHN